MLRLWNSRKRLTAISCSLLLMLALLRWARVVVEHRKLALSLDKSVDRSFDEDIDYALETFHYMQNWKIGKAEISPIVEEKKKVKSYRWRSCILMAPTQFNAVDDGWLENEDIFIYSATYDSRHNSLYPKNHVVQVLAVSYRSIAQATLFCNLFDLVSGRYAVVEASIREIWQRAWDTRDFFYVPNLISCPIPKHLQSALNLTVSLSELPCWNNKAIKIRNIPKNTAKKGIAVCVKGMDYLTYQPERLVEWIEMQFISGADTITFYTYYVPPTMKKVLHHYRNLGLITLVPIILPGESPNHSYIRSKFIWRNRQQKRRHELIPYNDCFYRHISTHEYVLILDIDELIVPLKHDNWSSMMEYLTTTHNRTEQADFSSFSILNAFKFPSAANGSAPEFMYMLNNRRISTKISNKGAYGKSFISTKSVATVFNHFALHRLHALVRSTIYVSEDVALKLHYKEKCPIESRNECGALQTITLDDTRLDRFAEHWTIRVSKVLKQLFQISDDK